MVINQGWSLRNGSFFAETLDGFLERNTDELENWHDNMSAIGLWFFRGKIFSFHLLVFCG